MSKKLIYRKTEITRLQERKKNAIKKIKYIYYLIFFSFPHAIFFKASQILDIYKIIYHTILLSEYYYHGTHSAFHHHRFIILYLISSPILKLINSLILRIGVQHFRRRRSKHIFPHLEQFQELPKVIFPSFFLAAQHGKIIFFRSDHFRKNRRKIYRSGEDGVRMAGETNGLARPVTRFPDVHLVAMGAEIGNKLTSKDQFEEGKKKKK